MIEVSTPTGRHVHGDSHRVFCGPGDEEVGYAPVRFMAKCVSPNGYKRKRHDYCVESRSGTRCLWCGGLQGWEKW